MTNNHAADLSIAKLGEAFWRAQAIRLEAEILALKAELAARPPPPAK